MNRSQKSSSKKRLAKRLAFTLVELLVVIVIIAILMSILIPVVNGVINQAHNTQARNDIHQFITAVKGYYTDYGKYPVDSTTQTGSADITYGDSKRGYGATSDNHVIVDVLRNNTNSSGNSSLVQQLNPRQQVYLEINPSKTTPATEGLDTNGNWIDPWGAQYYVMMDTNYDNLLTPPSNLPGLNTATNSNTAATGTFSQTVISWSLGKKQKNAIVSWQ